ncbi:ATP-grasp domain-containing protein [Achromobacter veterisilvae]|uniref:ATP-grasp domain-containing protein n=1 Tax=Achromobacter veterisilvae TaxID=2069367 RepID=A0ABZ2S333_9BURK
MNKVPVLVTGIGGGGHGEQILKALRMASTPYLIVGGDMNPFSKGLAEVDIPYILPPAKDPRYIDSLLQLCRKHSIKAMFHGSEPELKVMSASRDLIREAGVFLPINPAHVIDLCMDKAKTSEWLAAHGFDVPRTVQINEISDLDKVDFFPAVLKPSVGSGGSANIFLAQDRKELNFLGMSLLENIGPYIVQEYVGDTDSEFTVGVLFDMDGNFLNSIAVRRMILSGLSNRVRVRNRSGDPALGAILAISSGVSQGDVGPFPEVTGICEEIATALKCQGAVNIQCRLARGKVYVFEINPRFSGTTSLRAMVGYNEPDALIRKHVLGELVESRFAYRSGRVVRGLAEVLLPDSAIERV